MHNQWGTPEMSAKDILLKTLQGAPLQVTQKDDDTGKRVPDQAGTVAAQEKAAAIQKSFDEWVWEDPNRRERMEKIYNDTHNSSVPRGLRRFTPELPRHGYAVAEADAPAPARRDLPWRDRRDRTVGP